MYVCIHVCMYVMSCHVLYCTVMYGTVRMVCMHVCMYVYVGRCITHSCQTGFSNKKNGVQKTGFIITNRAYAALTLSLWVLITIIDAQRSMFSLQLVSLGPPDKPKAYGCLSIPQIPL